VVVLRGELEVCFRTFFSWWSHRDPRRVWGILVYNLMSDSPPFFLANRFLAWAQPLSHGILSSLLSDWNKGKTWFSNWPFRFDKLFKLGFAWHSAGGWMLLQRLEFLLLCLNLGIKVTQSCHTCSTYILPFPKTWRFYTVFKLKMFWKRPTEKVDHKRRVSRL
jgi:hypothetical protein